MKRTAKLMCLSSPYAGALWNEYHTALFLGTGCFLFAADSALGALAAAHWRAPEGYERRDGFYVAPRGRRTRLLRHIRSSQRDGREMKSRLSD
jgi:hypothetical protein